MGICGGLGGRRAYGELAATALLISLRRENAPAMAREVVGRGQKLGSGWQSDAGREGGIGTRVTMRRADGE